MTGFDPGLERACREALDAVAGPDDRAAALALVGLLRWSTHEVAMWFAAAAIALAGGTSTLTPDPTATSTATEAPAPAAQGSTGDILDADTAQALNGAVRTAFELGEATVGFGIRL